MDASPAAGWSPVPRLLWSFPEVGSAASSPAAVEELKGLFTTLTPGTAQQPSGPAFDCPFLEDLGLSLTHLYLCKSSETLFCTETVLVTVR